MFNQQQIPDNRWTFLRRLKDLAIVAALLTLNGAAQNQVSMQHSQFAALRDGITAKILSFEPEEMRMLGYSAAGQLKDWSPEAISEELRLCRDSIKTLESFDEGLTRDDLLDRAVLLAHLRYLEYFYGQYHGELGNLQISAFPWDAVQYEMQQLETGAKDDASTRQRITGIEGILRAIPAYLRQQNLNLTAGLRLRLPDKEILLRILERIGSPSEQDSIRGGLQLLAKHLASMSAIPTLQKDVMSFLVERAEAAYSNHAEFLRQEMLPKSQETWALGETEYKRRLDLIYGFQGSLDELIEPAERELRQLKKEMNNLAHELRPDLTENDTLYADVLKSLRLKRASSGEELLSAYRTIQQQIDTKITTVLGLPAGAATYQAAPPGVPVDPATNWPAPLLSEGQAIVLVDISPDGLRDNTLVDLAWIAAHEGNPGHAAQSLFFQENFHRDKAALCRFFGIPDEVGYVRGNWYAMVNIEGWAFYTERLLLASDLLTKEERLAALTGQALRAARVVLDVRMHTAGWSRERAADYLVNEAGQTPEAAHREAFRYSRIPLQALSYYLGAKQFEQLRAKYGSRIGDRFYTEILSLGPVPPQLIGNYLEGSKSPENK